MQPMLMQPALWAMTFLLVTSLAASAQSTAPAPGVPPGPTNPPNPQAQPGATIVINPTQEECQRGWDTSLRWTQDQFRDFCTKMGASK
jgi:hypothetical protein